ncbi:MAG: PilZ domain-containing protein [Candidatus Aureabacteria bacterium]|nr:PilZ domain-containing protein [Candidatus Auribacterota bacterium]
MFNTISNGENRRRYHRARVKVAIKLARATSALTWIQAYTRDISLGGLCIDIDQKLSPYSMVKILLESTEANQSITIFGRVLWVVEPKEDEEGNAPAVYTAGIQFLNLHTEEGKKLIMKLMSKKR